MKSYGGQEFARIAAGPSVLPAVIANGEALSAAVQVAGRLCGIVTPAAWTAAAMTFQASVDGATYLDVYDAATERTVSSASIPTTVGKHLHLAPLDWKSINYVKVRSGTAAAAVNQGAARSVLLVLST